MRVQREMDFRYYGLLFWPKVALKVKNILIDGFVSYNHTVFNLGKTIHYQLVSGILTLSEALFPEP